MQRLLPAIVVIGSVLLLMNACDRLPTQPQGSDIEEPAAEFQIDDFQFEEPDVAVDLATGDVQLHRGHRRVPFSLFCILRRLELSPEQKDSVRQYLREYQECVYPTYDSLRRAIRHILAQYRSEFREIIRSYRNGEIDRDSLRTLIRQMVRQMRQQIRELYQWAREHVVECKEELFRKIGGILNDDQREIWEEWLENGGRCNGWRFRDRDRDRHHGDDHGRRGG